MTTWNEVAGRQIHALDEALGGLGTTRDAAGLLRNLFSGWGHRDVPTRPGQSIVSDDQSPYEFSVAFEPKGPELRLLFEAQGDVDGLASKQRVALALNERLRVDYGIDLRRFREVEDLFCPVQPRGMFAVWHAVSARPGDAPTFKLYLNPNVQGQERARPLVAEALRRLGFDEPARRFAGCVDWRGEQLDQLAYFSLDLTDSPAARVKVYTVHHTVTPAEIDRMFAVAPTHQPGDIVAYCGRVLGHVRRLNRKSVSTCFAYVGGKQTPKNATLHLPVASYTPSDDFVVDRVSGYMQSLGLAAGAYERGVGALTRAESPPGTKVQSYVSFRRDPAGPRLTVYLSPNNFRVSKQQYGMVANKSPVSQTMSVEGAGERVPATKLRKISGGHS